MLDSHHDSIPLSRRVKKASKTSRKWDRPEIGFFQQTRNHLQPPRCPSERKVKVSNGMRLFVALSLSFCFSFFRSNDTTPLLNSSSTERLVETMALEIEQLLSKVSLNAYKVMWLMTLVVMLFSSHVTS